MRLPLPRGRRAILVLGLPVGLAAAGAFAFLQLSSSSAATPVPDPAPGQHGAMLALDERVINLQSSGVTGTYRYAKIGVTVELRPESPSFYDLQGDGRATAEKELLAKHSESVPLLLDALGNVVSSHDSAGLSGPDARTKLKDELLAAMRKILGEREVLDVYFTDLVMQ